MCRIFICVVCVYVCVVLFNFSFEFANRWELIYLENAEQKVMRKVSRSCWWCFIMDAIIRTEEYIKKEERGLKERWLWWWVLDGNWVVLVLVLLLCDVLHYLLASSFSSLPSFSVCCCFCYCDYCCFTSFRCLCTVALSHWRPRSLFSISLVYAFFISLSLALSNVERRQWATVEELIRALFFL